VRTAIYRADNDWLVEFCSYDPRRLHGIAALPGEDIQASILLFFLSCPS
jgi:hypothetical protein